MKRHRAEGDGWPPSLAVFNPSDWPPEPGEVRDSCRCSHCAARFGPLRPAGASVLEAHARWRKARLATLVKGTPEYRAESLRGLREAVEIQGIRPEEGEE